MIYDTTWRESPAVVLHPPAEAGRFPVRELVFPSAAGAGVCVAPVTSILVVLSGRLEHADGAAVVSLKPRQALVVPAGAPHRGFAGRSRCRCLCVEAAAGPLEAMSVPPGTFDGIRAISSPRVAMLALALRTALGARGAERSAIRIDGLASELMATVIRECAPGDVPACDWLARLRERLDAGIDAPLALESAVAEAGLPADRVRQRFTREYGDSIESYVRRLRIDRAAAALVGSDEPIARIAIAAGFFDQSHFTRTFKRIYGTTPAEQRRTGT